jgi:hypothetical protein
MYVSVMGQFEIVKKKEKISKRGSFTSFFLGISPLSLVLDTRIKSIAGFIGTSIYRQQNVRPFLLGFDSFSPTPTTVQNLFASVVDINDQQ